MRADARERLIRLAFETGAVRRRPRAGAAHSSPSRPEHAPGSSRSGSWPGHAIWSCDWRGRPRAVRRARPRSTAPVDLRRRLFYWRARCLRAGGLDGPAGFSLSRPSRRAIRPTLRALRAAARVAGGRRAAARRCPIRRRPRPRSGGWTSCCGCGSSPRRRRRRACFPPAAAGTCAWRSRSSRSAASRRPPRRPSARFPRWGPPREARVPDGWRRLYYPIEEGRISRRAAPGSSGSTRRCCAASCARRASSRRTRSRAPGALGLTQLLPSTARSVARSVLRVRYRRAFLYDPGSQRPAGRGLPADLSTTSSTETRCSRSPPTTAGPAGWPRCSPSNPGLEEDEIFESHPAYESRDYVRRVMLYRGVVPAALSVK